MRITLDSGSGSFRPGSRFQLVSGETRDEGIWESHNSSGGESRIEITLDQGSGSVPLC